MIELLAFGIFDFNNGASYCSEAINEERKLMFCIMATLFLILSIPVARFIWNENNHLSTTKRYLAVAAALFALNLVIAIAFTILPQLIHSDSAGTCKYNKPLYVDVVFFAGTFLSFVFYQVIALFLDL